MPRCADIKVTPTSLKLDSTRKGKFVVTARNALGKPFTACARVKIDKPVAPPPGAPTTAGQPQLAQPAWITIDVAQFEFGADKTQSIEVSVAVPPTAAPGTYTFQIQIYNNGNPDEDFENSETLSVQVPAPVVVTGGGLKTWMILVIIGAVVLIGGVVAAVIIVTGGPKLGDSCKDKACKEGTCSDDQICVAAIGEKCKKPNQCATGTCTDDVCAGGALGQPCKTEKDCGAGATCDGKVCQGQDGTKGCSKGADCVSDNCAQGTCAAAAAHGSCEKAKCPKNQECFDWSDPRQCPNPGSDICKKLAALGKECLLIGGEHCNGDVDCFGAFCKPGKKVCAPANCADNDDCGPHLACPKGTGARQCKIAVGESCKNDADCETAVCDGGKCIQSTCDNHCGADAPDCVRGKCVKLPPPPPVPIRYHISEGLNSVSMVALSLFETGTDRPGSDIRMIGLPSPTPGLCRTACLNEPQCKAFTYVKPNVQPGQGPTARCYLKNPVPNPKADACCTSGVK